MAKGMMGSLPEWLSAEQSAKIKKLKKRGKMNKAKKLLGKWEGQQPQAGAGQDINVGASPIGQPMPPAPQDAYTTDPLSKDGANLIYQPINEQVLTSLGQAKDAMANPFNLEGISAAPTMDDFAGERQRIENDLYNRSKGRIDQDFGERREQMGQSLANKGIPIGSELYNKEMDRFEQNYQDSLGDARSNAMQAGTAEQQRLYNNAWNSRQNEINERLGVRGQSLNEFNAMQPWYGYQAAERGQQSGFAHQADMAQQQHGYNKELANLQAKNAIKVAQNTPRGGGGGLGYDPFAMQNLKHNQNIELMQMQQAFDMMQQGAPQQGNSKGQQSANAAAAGFGQGVGAAIG